MKKYVLAAVAVLAIAGSGAAYAQHRSHHHRHFSAQDKVAFVDARIAAVKAGLKLTPDQEKNWPTVESAVRDFAKQRIDRAEARRAERQARRAERKDKSADQRAGRSGGEIAETRGQHGGDGGWPKAHRGRSRPALQEPR